MPSRTIFSTLLSKTATAPFIGYNSKSRVSIGIFPYLGSTSEAITNIIFTVAPKTNVLTSGTLDLRNHSTSTIIASGNYSYTGTTALSTISLTTITNLPSNLSLLDLGITTNGKQLNVYSIVVK
jgi:hypothetical protein